MIRANFIEQMNEWGRMKVPFLFVVDFEMNKPFVLKLTDVQPSGLLFDINGFTNVPAALKATPVSPIHVQPPDRQDYHKKFDYVFDRLCYGDSFLTNLTVKTRVATEHTLQELFLASRARYKLMTGSFLVFSPEIFVQIRGGNIFSYPMKGTIDAALPGAAARILNDRKEKAEHTTIVDLIRNDLSLVATHVQVQQFRYLEELRTSHKNLLQVSSEIVGRLPGGYRSALGSILTALLPAGSVSGAPKAKTLEIIRAAEGEERGYYTGVFGYFDGENLDSGVMIRYIEKQGPDFFYRSGGGITTQSNADAEYQEAIDKVYVPLD